MSSSLTKAPRLSAVFFTISLILTCLMVYLGNTIFLAQGNLNSILSVGRRNYDALAQFQISFERMGNLALRHSTGMDPEPARMILQYRMLQAQFAEFSGPAGNDGVSDDALAPDFRSNLLALGGFMQELVTELPKVQNDPAGMAGLVRSFEKMRKPVEQMTQAVRNFEHSHSIAGANHVTVLRRSMYVSGLLLWANFSVWVMLLLLSVRQARMLIRKQEVAIDAEQQAVIAGQQAVMNKNTMLGMISHELRTPLQTIISSIDLLTLHQQKQVRSDSNVITRLGEASIQLEAQLKDLTDYARLDADKLSLRFAVCQPVAMMRAVVGNFDGLAKRKGLTLVADIGDSELAILSDEYRIQQIASNLVSNAIKYSERGEVRVQLVPLQPGSATLCFSVSDTGPGIAAEDLPRLFEPFTQIDQSHTRRYDGAGLGLAIVKGLVDLFGGQIRVCSTVGHGTRFDVSLPVAQAVSTPHAEANAYSANRRTRVLLVDDNADVRASLKDVLEQLGYQCITADSGAVALKKAAEQRYAAILLDIQMPEMDGFSVAAQLRRSAGPNQYSPIIGISAYSQKRNTEAELRFFSHYLMKPIRQERLRALLQTSVQPQL
ncbi:MAG TPA: hypothetical protein DCW29_23675 [Janthinobacterium sp.]|nr:hypothetical protein [Janthinobacterium sp.]